jgi:hypothetical protein
LVILTGCFWLKAQDSGGIVQGMEASTISRQIIIREHLVADLLR